MQCTSVKPVQVAVMTVQPTETAQLPLNIHTAVSYQQLRTVGYQLPNKYAGT
jgi:hypothetical protein